MRRIILLFLVALVFCLVFSSVCSAGEAQIRMHFGGGGIRYVPQPRLIRPLSEVVDLKHAKGLVFEWSSHELPARGREYYQFKIYKGYQMYAANLYVKKKLSRGTTKIRIGADNFENGKVYTWVVRQRDNLHQWSSYSFHSFKVVK